MSRPHYIYLFWNQTLWSGSGAKKKYQSPNKLIFSVIQLTWSSKNWTRVSRLGELWECQDHLRTQRQGNGWGLGLDTRTQDHSLTSPGGSSNSNPRNWPTWESQSFNNNKVNKNRLGRNHAFPNGEFDYQDALQIIPTLTPPSWLNQLLPGWESITSDQWVLMIIKEGYSIEFRMDPPLHTFRMTPSTDILPEEVQKLLSKIAIELEPTGERSRWVFSRYFVVPKRDGGLHPILDLWDLSNYIVYRKFQMVTLQSIIPLISKGDWLPGPPHPLDCLLSHHYLPLPQEVPQIHDRRPTVPIQNPSFWYLYSPKGIYEDNGSGQGQFKNLRDHDIPIYR